MKTSNSFLMILSFLYALIIFSVSVWADDSLEKLERLASTDPKPFVLLEAFGEESVNRGQGVVISAEGHVLSAGHIGWNGTSGQFVNNFRVSFRGSGDSLPSGFIHVHKAIIKDREDAESFEHSYSAQLQGLNGSRFIGKGDLALFTIKADSDFPTVEFYSKEKPKVEMGDVFHLCHYCFPHHAAEPTFLINPVEIVGVAMTSSGMQYLAKGYYRVGSSGGALLKDGRLIGIQSAAYTVNAKGIGEIPMGLISFQLVWSDLVEEHLNLPSDEELE